MNEPADTLYITVEFYDGQEEGDVGYPYYVAHNDRIGGVTDGRTWNELMRNLEEMIGVTMEDEDTVAAYNLVPNPRIVITMELPKNYVEMK